MILYGPLFIGEKPNLKKIGNIILRILNGVVGIITLVFMFALLKFYKETSHMMMTMTHEQLTSLSAVASFGLVILAFMGALFFISLNSWTSALETDKSDKLQAEINKSVKERGV
jgi:hypothetical protein